MRIRETLLIASREVREALRSRWFVLAAASFLALSLGLSLLGLAGAERSGLAGFDRTTASMLNLALLFVPLLTLTVGGLSIAGELEDGALSMLLAQPVTRLEVFAGKLAGLMAALTAAILTGFGATGVLVGIFAGGGQVRAFAGLLGAVLLLALATLALGALLSVALQSRARAIGGAFAAWLGLVYLSDLGSIGLAISRELSAAQVFMLALLNPVEQARLLGTFSLSSRLDLLGPAAAYGIDRFGAGGLTVLLVGALLTGAAAFASLGYAAFRKAVVP